MSVSRTDIANLALNHVGEPPITNLLDDQNATARIVKVVFDPTIREMGRDHEWNCLRTRADIPRDGTNPPFGYAYRYQLPLDFIRLFRLNGRDVQKRKDLFDIEGRFLLTDAETAQIQYSKFERDSTVYDSKFVEALALLIGSKIAIQIRQDEALKGFLKQEYNRALSSARKVDGNETNQAPYDGRSESGWIAARRVGTRNGSLNNDAF